MPLVPRAGLEVGRAAGRGRARAASSQLRERRDAGADAGVEVRLGPPPVRGHEPVGAVVRDTGNARPVRASAPIPATSCVDTGMVGRRCRRSATASGKYSRRARTGGRRRGRSGTRPGGGRPARISASPAHGSVQWWIVRTASAASNDRRRTAAPRRRRGRPAPRRAGAGPSITADGSSATTVRSAGS